MALRATRQDVEIASTGTGNLRVTRQAVEVLGVAGAAPIERTVAQGLVFSQSDSTTKTLSLSLGAQSLIFGDLGESNVREETVTQSLIFSQSIGYNKTFAISVSSSFLFTQEVTASPYVDTLEQGLVFSQILGGGLAEEYSESQGLVFSQNISQNLVHIQQSLIFSQTVGVGKVIPGGIERDASNNLAFNQSVAKVKILSTATSHSATQSLIFEQFSGFPKEKTVQQVFVFSQTVSEDFIIHVQQWLLFDQEKAETNLNRNPVAVDGLVFQHAFIVDDIGSTCQYDPILGYSSDPNAPTPPSATAPTLVRQNYVKFYYPTTSPTKVVQIRTPMLGDRDRVENMRVQRESRGGTLQVYADPTWPKLNILALTFTALTEAEAVALQQFFLDTLGLDVGFIDWEGRTWHGLIVSPDEPFVRSRRNIVDVSLEFEGELQ